jgi:predicted DNA binding CopG/RHH family protein
MTQEHESQQGQRSRIPDFASREEMAEWFETHDLADYWDEFKPVKVRFAKNLSEGLHVRLDEENLTKLRQQAQERGVGSSTLVRMWILEHLQAKHDQGGGLGHG